MTRLRHSRWRPASNLPCQVPAHAGFHGVAMFLSLRVPHNGPRAGFLECDIVDRLDYCFPEGGETPTNEEDLAWWYGATLLKMGWDRDAGRLDIPTDSESVRVICDAINGACNCLDDEIEHADKGDELVSINKSLRSAGEGLIVAIRNGLKGLQ